MKLMQKLTNRKGFTLVELMIVVAIIGILAALAIPAFLKAIKRSKVAEADGIMKTATQGAASYFASDQKCYFGIPVATASEPWHVAGCPLAGIPIVWDNKVFPGGTGYTFNTTGAEALADAGPTSSPQGGSKLLPFQTAAPTPIMTSTLNKLKMDLTEATYFTYSYTNTLAGQNATAQVLATANFDTANAEMHTVTQNIDIQGQEVRVLPSFTTNEYF